MISTPILATHLRRKAVIYIRQSTVHQVLSNQESQQMQLDMKHHALRLGWPEALIDIVELDTGNSAKTTDGRTGYKKLLSELALGEVGIVLSYESTRLSRNCSDWYPLLDLCTLNRCLIGDRDGVYDPATPNGRLLLGMKGMVSELELHTLQGRLTAGIDSKAKRGELALPLPIGYVRLDDGAVVKDPDLQVQESIQLVFRTFLEQHSCGKVVRHFRQHGLLFPARSQDHRLRFEAPRPGPVLRMLRTPTYAGAYVFGRTRWSRRTDPNNPGHQSNRIPQEQWRVLIKDHFPGYVDWDTFQRIQSMLANNYMHHRRRESQGIARNGAALLSGLCYCGHCGHQMRIACHTTTAYYRCFCIRQPDESTPRHDSFRSDLVDLCVQQSFFAALMPVELDLYEAAYQRTREQNAQVCAAQERQLQRLRYEVNRARRQYDQADPENRLVASELERRWEAALRALQQAEQRYEQDQRQMRSDAQRRIPLELRTQFASVGQALPGLWPMLPMATRKELLRCLVTKVVLKRLPTLEQLLVRIIWRGGAYTDKELVVPPPSGHSQTQTSGLLVPRVMELVEQGCSDAQIAEQLTAQGFRSPRRHHLRKATVASIRCQQGQRRNPGNHSRRRVGGKLTVGRLAHFLGVPRHCVYSLIYRGVIKIERDQEYGCYLFPGDPQTLEQLRRLRDKLIHNIDLTQEHQDA